MLTNKVKKPQGFCGIEHDARFFWENKSSGQAHRAIKSGRPENHYDDRGVFEGMGRKLEVM